MVRSERLDSFAMSMYLPVRKVSDTFLMGKYFPKSMEEAHVNETIRPDEAAAALAEIGQRQEDVIRQGMVPRWYWWSIAVMTVGFTAAVDSQVPLAIGLGTAAFVTAVVTVTVVLVARTARRAQPRNDLLRPLGVLAILGFVAAILAVALPTAFALDQAGVPYPATWGALAGAVVMVAGEPVLRRALHRIMLANRVGVGR